MNKWLDVTGVVYLWSAIKDKFVTKETGKVLSSNDFTSVLKTKLDGVANSANNYTHPANHPASVITQDASNRFVSDAKMASWDAKASSAVVSTTANGIMLSTDKVKIDGIEAGAEVNILESVKVNGTVSPITTKSVNITVPTKVSQVTNDSLFQTQSQVTTAINTAIGSVTGIDFKVVTELPTTGAKGTIYLKSNGGGAQNIYDEYIYVENKFEKIGTTAVDLSGYLLKTDAVSITTAELDTICV